MNPYDGARWLNEPEVWSRTEDGLQVTTDAETDFWQRTFYNFVRDSGHFLHRPATGDFTASVEFVGRYSTLYDQAGLMLRVDAANWIKLGIEYSDGVCNFSLVCTVDGRSDWSVIPSAQLSGPQAVRITRVGGAAIAHFRTPEGPWRMMRLCPFSETETVMVGPMTCSPQRAGFEVLFTQFDITPPIANPLHG